MNIRGNAAAAAVLAAAVSLASPGPAETFTPRPASGIKGALLPTERSLWTYDKASGAYVGGGRRRLEALSRRICASLPSPSPSPSPKAGRRSRSRSRSTRAIYKIAEDLGIKIIYCDQEFKTEKAVTCAETAVAAEAGLRGRLELAVRGAAEAIMKI